MMKTILIAAASMALGTGLGVVVRHAMERHKRHAGKGRHLRASPTPPTKKKMGTMDKVLVFEAVLLISYTVAVLVIFYHVGSEPTTLTACVFGVCGFENGVMGWIKTTKEKQEAEANKASRGGHKADRAEPPTEREEPPDVGL